MNNGYQTSYNNKSVNSENFGVIFRQKNTIKHSKGNKVKK